MPVEPAELRSPLGVVALFPQDLSGDPCIPFVLGWAFSFTRSLLFLLVLASSGFSGMLHVLLSSLSLQSCAWFILPLRPVVLGRRCWISSAPRFVGFTVPTVQTRAKSHWETVGFSREVRFSLPVSAPRRLRWGWLFFPAALTMKEFSTFLGLLLAPDADVSVVPACMVVLPGPSSASQVTLSIAPCLLCWRRSLSPWCWRRVLGGSTSPSCSFTWGSYSVGPSKPSTWVFVVPAFGPGFHLGRSPRRTCPYRTLAYWLTPLSFLRPFISARWDPLSKGWYSPLMFPFSPTGDFWLTLLCYPILLHGVPTVVSLGFASHLRS